MPHHGHNAVSKVTLDIICVTAFGYESNSLTNPHNALKVAYEELMNLQSGMITYFPLLLTSRNSLTLRQRARPKYSRLFCPYVHPRYTRLFHIGMELPPPALVTVSANHMCAPLVRSCRLHPGR